LLLDALFLGPLRARRQFYDLVILDSKMNISKKRRRKPGFIDTHNLSKKLIISMDIHKIFGYFGRH